MKIKKPIPWRKIRESTVLTRFGRSVRKVRFQLPDGNREVFHINQERPTVCILALTSQNSVILTKQFRPGPARILLELPGGYIDPGQTPVHAAKKELLEETGYLGKLTYVSTFFQGAYSTAEKFCFVAVNCKRVQEQYGGRHEFISVKLVSIAEFKRILRSGLMTDIGAGFLGLDKLALL